MWSVASTRSDAAHAPRQHARVRALKRSQTVFLCALSFLRLVRSFSGVELTMMSSQDLLFSLAVEKLPKQLASAMVSNGLMHPAVLSHYPRKSAVELGLVPAQEVKGAQDH